MLQVYTGFEEQVAGQLSRESIEAFFPSYRHKDRFTKKEVRRPFFPGYVFACFPLSRRRIASAVPRVLRILAQELSDAEVQSVRIVGQLAKAAPSDRTVIAGDKVSIRCGPLAGVEGIVQRRKGKVRVVVTVQALGKSIEAEVDVNWLRSEK